MSTETLQDSNYRTIGYIEDQGNQLVGKDANYRIVGYYDKNTNQTKDANYRIVGNGNMLSGLVYGSR